MHSSRWKHSNVGSELLKILSPVTVINSNPLMEHRDLLSENIWPQAAFSHNQSSVHIVFYTGKSLLWSVYFLFSRWKASHHSPGKRSHLLQTCTLHYQPKTQNLEQTVPGGCRCCKFDVGLKGELCCQRDRLLMEFDTDTILEYQGNI